MIQIRYSDHSWQWIQTIILDRSQFIPASQKLATQKMYRWLKCRHAIDKVISISSAIYVQSIYFRCGNGCVLECRICNQEVVGSNLSRGYFAPRSTLPSIPTGSVNEYQLRLGRQRQVWLITIADERVGVQVKLWIPFRTSAIPERFCGGDSLRRGAISSVCTFYL